MSESENTMMANPNNDELKANTAVTDEEMELDQDATENTSDSELEMVLGETIEMKSAKLDSGLLETFYSTGTLSDITIHYNSKEFKFHKLLLSLKSGFFKSALLSFKQDSMDLTDTPFPEKHVMFVLDAIYERINEDLFYNLLQSGLDISVLLQCTNYFQMQWLADWVRDLLAKLPDWDLEDPLVFNKAISTFHNCTNFPAFEELCGYIQSKEIIDHSARFEDLPFVYLKYILENGKFKGTNHDVFDFYGKVYKISNERQRLVLKPLLYKHLSMENVQTTSFFNISFAESQEDSSTLFDQYRITAWNLPKPIKYEFVKDDVQKEMLFRFSYAMVDYRFKFKKGDKVQLYLHSKPHLLPDNRIPICNIDIHDAETLQTVESQSLEPCLNRYLGCFQESKLKKEELGYGWASLADYLTKNKKYLITMEFKGLVDIPLAKRQK